MTRSRFAPQAVRFAGLVSVTLFGLVAAAQPVQASLVWDANASDYGYLWQYSIPAPLGAEACGPTATTNAFTFLQNTQGGRVGDALTGSDYPDWLQTAKTLANDYMQTGEAGSANPGTVYGHLTTGMQQYAEAWHEGHPDRAKIQFNGVSFGDKRYDPDHPERGTFPDWVKLLDNQGPTIEQLYQMLAGGAGVVMGMNLPDETGHIVTLAGMDWDDVNGDGIVDPGEATLSIIDPLDPSSHYENPEPDPYGADGLQPQKAVFTKLNVWEATVLNPKTQQPMSGLATDYAQYQGSHDPNQPNEPYTPYDGRYGTAPLFIAAAFSMKAVPEPTSGLIWGSLLLGAAVSRRRRTV